MNIKLFATLKDMAGSDQIQVTGTAETVAQLVEIIRIQFPVIADGLSSSIVAVNHAFADPYTVIGPDDEIAIFPPVSGG